MKTMNEFIQSYLDSKKHAWAPSTLNSERARLFGNIGLIEEGIKNPSWAFEQLQRDGLKPYTIKTMFIRFANLFDFLIQSRQWQGENSFSIFMKSNANLFKHAYKKETLSVSFDEAARLISTLKDDEIREKAKRLLVGGFRYTESFTEKDGQVTGKGSKARPIFAPKNVGCIEFKKSYATFRRALKVLGLKPHTLRKLFANMLVEQGAGEMDLLKAMGWESIQTAASYLQAKRDEELKKLVINPFA